MNVASAEHVLTARMACERLRPEHEAEISGLVLDPRVARWIEPDGLPAAESEIGPWLRAKDEHWRRYGFGQWLLRDRPTGEVVGRGGLQHTDVGGGDEVEVGWAIVPERWGQGLATEMAMAAVELAFGSLGLDQLIAFTVPENHASVRVMQKAGFAYERGIVHVGLPHVLYRRLAAG